jgi:hypothetical protein
MRRTNNTHIDRQPSSLPPHLAGFEPLLERIAQLIRDRSDRNTPTAIVDHRQREVSPRTAVAAGPEVSAAMIGANQNACHYFAQHFTMGLRAGLRLGL